MPLSSSLQTGLQSSKSDSRSRSAGAVGDHLGNHTATEDLKMAGWDITGVGAIDGRDPAVDGAKLDLIEPSAFLLGCMVCSLGFAILFNVLIRLLWRAWVLWALSKRRARQAQAPRS